MQNRAKKYFALRCLDNIDYIRILNYLKLKNFLKSHKVTQIRYQRLDRKQYQIKCKLVIDSYTGSDDNSN